MTLETDLNDYLLGKDFINELKNISIEDNIKLRVGVLIERVLIDSINNSGIFDKNYEIPDFFEESNTGGYTMRSNTKRAIFEIDGYQVLDSKPYYLEIKSGHIPNSYFDKSYKNKKSNSSSVDISKIFNMSLRYNLKPNLIIFYNSNIQMKNKKLIKRVQRDFPNRISMIGFEFDHNYYSDLVFEHNQKLFGK